MGSLTPPASDPASEARRGVFARAPLADLAIEKPPIEGIVAPFHPAWRIEQLDRVVLDEDARRAGPHEHLLAAFEG
jgi:hypothetical protein